MSPFFLALCPILADILLKLSLPPSLCLRISRCLTCSQLTVIGIMACSVLNSSSSLRPPSLPPALFPCTRAVDGCQLHIRVLAESLFSSEKKFKAPLFHQKFPERLLPADLLSLSIFQMFAETLPSANEHNIPVSISIPMPFTSLHAFHCKMQEFAHRFLVKAIYESREIHLESFTTQGHVLT